MCKFEELDRKNIQETMKETAGNTECIKRIDKKLDSIDKNVKKIPTCIDSKISCQSDSCKEKFTDALEDINITLKEIKETVEILKRDNEDLLPLTKFFRHVKNNILVYLAVGIGMIVYYYKEIISKITT